MPEKITIDGRGNSIHDAIVEMWVGCSLWNKEGYNPVSGVQIVNATTKETVQTFQLADPEFQAHLKSDESGKIRPIPAGGNPHVSERKEHFKYIARIELV